MAREALSARLDRERAAVPSARVDEHLEACGACSVWFEQVAGQARRLRGLVADRPVDVSVVPVETYRTAPQPRSSLLTRQRWALLYVGIAQIALGIVQGLGVHSGLSHQRTTGSGNHLLDEATSWTIALGAAMVGAALWPSAAAGVAGVLTAFVLALTGYVVGDAVSGAVAITRSCTQLPLVIGAILAIMLWRNTATTRPVPAIADIDIVLPENASRGRRRDHLWPIDGSAA
ncbi:hypothetical protein MB901379_00197 [Mycobacterium basiliense]|uniref:Putative zinc-finger domain-containing protein n=1 Tax=Mycobacterium basiliense TaxID=2094119 RepID=A0A447G832_9MYCO|nr:hypothetical protein MB901379_00197 [Mycobacterium basiliense]